MKNSLSSGRDLDFSRLDLRSVMLLWILRGENYDDEQSTIDFRVYQVHQNQRTRIVAAKGAIYIFLHYTDTRGTTGKKY